MTSEVEWMDPIDEPILEALCDEAVFSPDHVATEVGCRPPEAAYRCRELTKRGLLENHMTGVYDITTDGKAVLAGDLDPAALEER